MPDTIYRVSGSEKTEQLLTKSQWQRLGRKVREGEKPVAVRLYTVHEPRPGYVLLPNGERKETTQRVEVTKEAKLYSTEQTQPYKGSQRTGASMLFYDFFCRDSCKERHIRSRGSEMDGTPGWKNWSGRLTENDVQSHINMLADRRTGIITKLGIIGGEYTRFLLIDHDLHGGDRDVFLAQAEVLINNFYGHDGWHCIAADKNANGIHLVRAFRDPVRTEAATSRLRHFLQEIDLARPDLTC